MTKMYVKDGTVCVCVTMVCDKVVCERWCVCVKDCVCVTCDKVVCMCVKDDVW